MQHGAISVTRLRRPLPACVLLRRIPQGLGCCESSRSQHRAGRTEHL